jgi:hypothetical protein
MFTHPFVFVKAKLKIKAITIIKLIEEIKKSPIKGDS